MYKEFQEVAVKKYDETLVFHSMLGKTFHTIIFDEYDKDQLEFIANDLEVTFLHYQDCCEDVRIEDIAGDLNNLIGSPITQAECYTEDIDDTNKSETWTFYKFATLKGYVTVRWLGESNGYYSEEVDFKIEKKINNENYIYSYNPFENTGKWIKEDEWWW